MNDTGTFKILEKQKGYDFKERYYSDVTEGYKFQKKAFFQNLVNISIRGLKFPLLSFLFNTLLKNFIRFP